MNNLPGTIPREVSRSHPRRQPAHRSVSLRHSPPPKADAKGAIVRQPTALSSPNLASDKANPPSVSPQLLSNKNSSGESSDAGRWFETTNNNAHQSGASFNDNDPPFFLRNSSSSETPPDGNSAHLPREHSTMPYRPGMATMGTDGSSTEDFRSVIDDLTVANKKLKQKLRKYEKVYDAHLREEKLFEVRFHGLPDHKKKELEETLRKFAAGLDDVGITDYPPISYAPALEQQKTQSSTSRFAESGYASLSASGQNSSAVSNQASIQADDIRKMSRSAYNRQQQSIQSYLHDIPVGLLPHSNVPMTDKSKKKLVVRRLEQVFAGKRSTPGNHSQPMQQEEVAQSAATADREEKEATGRYSRPEGLRVARIRPESSNEEDTSEINEALQGFRSHLYIGEHDFAGAGSPDQRPTRPLDLDPFRAQVPGENMDYIRHLGFTPPDMDTGDAPEDGHGWLYLNLLINMAQLHTLNVTPEFVKDALTDYSGHLELSRDGRKVRWKGGRDVTKNSSDSSSEHLSGNSPLEHGSPSKRLKTENGGGTDEYRPDPEQMARKLARAKREREMNKFAYTPMFFRKQESEDDEDDYEIDVESSGASLQQIHHAGNSSGFGSSAVQSGSSSKRRRDDGPMIFYTKAKFCTDLSGDRLGTSLMPGAYKAFTSHPIGDTSQLSVAAPGASGLTEPRGPLNATPKYTGSNNGTYSSASEHYLDFSPAALRNDFSGSGSVSPDDVMDFEASGLGGVQPDDNFSIHVRRSQTQVVPTGNSGRRRSSVLPNKIAHALAQPPNSETKTTSPSSRSRVIREEILSAARKTLPASTLPPASFLPFDSTSSGDVDSDLESEASSEADTDSDDGPTTALQLLNVSPGHSIRDSDSVSEASQYSEDTDDGSVDFLATARQLDPRAIRTQEREYDAALADRLAEEIVAGSSAATAGGGSGFNTPAVPVTPSQRGSASKRASTTSGSMSSRAKLKRPRTSDSAGVKKQPKSQKTKG